ncbi:NAD(P)-binding protein [Gluconacetobacter azotocaptans]|uniref:Tryptophan 2-monooxygenase n=1 Tax=Gluconacetobacter azotocaptans TaxID=142834 RepID=A0A7W4JW38_9PROT|nr:flavin monoamine oxidase family protein [Gluconacetobacter azotocaptans]MBB2191857.1 NAD(P)-binding protein [Gluconacetobacter azotocaptans]GBQ33335.1 flavin-containing amine oxidase [Gluconacetobacter azotocaptans DSM 13594]
MASQTRRQLLTALGLAGGTAALYQAMTVMGHAADSRFSGPPVLSGARKGSKVLVLGAGLAGMLAAYELRKAGYSVRILEYQDRPGGRNWTLRGGDRVVEMGTPVQKVGFSPGNYINPGPWRIPYHHRALLHYCKQFGVPLEPFIQLNYNAFVHSAEAFGGKPMRYRDVACDFTGVVAELLAKSIDGHTLDQELTQDDRAQLKEAMRGWGLLDENLRYTSSVHTSTRRGWERRPGGGPDGAPVPSQLLDRHDLFKPGMWQSLAFFMNYEMQTTMFQPVGGVDMIGKGFAKQVADLITMHARVTRIAQDQQGVRVTWEHTASGKVSEETADWCVCTIPLSVLSQIDVQVAPAMKAAIGAVPYTSHIKMGLEFKRRFWEQDDDIYGGISFTSGEISQVSYPSYGYHSSGPGVLLGAYTKNMAGLDIAGMSPAERIETGLAQGSVLHPQYRKEFSNGVAVAWSRIPWSLGCCAIWSEESRKQHYRTLTEMDGRIVLAGEHASYLGCWQEGALLSSLDAITRLHKRAQEA